MPLTRRWTDLRKRAASALALAIPFLFILWYGGIVFDVTIGAVTIILWEEWAQLCSRGSRLQPSWQQPPSSWPALSRPSPGSVGTPVTPAESPSSRRLALLAGLIWIALAAAALVSLRTDPIAGRANVIFVILLIWATDIGAYTAGRALGGPKLAPHISPGKTWSGAAGGLLAAVAAGIFVAAAQSPATGLPSAAAIAAALSIIGQAGDLLESLAKRRFGVKDSGHLIPGHGGALDRLDATLAVLPVAWLLAEIAGHGVVMWR